MDTAERREKLLSFLRNAKKPLTGTQLAREFSVSRQIIVGDISVIRATGTTIYATPTGYVLPEDVSDDTGLVATIACHHDKLNMRRELEIIVDNGGFVRDVIVEHPLYGEIRADLMLGTRHDVDVFAKRMDECEARPLSMVTSGIHLHTIEVKDDESLSRICSQLRECGILSEV